MSVPVIDKNVGHSTAYAYAKAKGYTGTEEEFAQLMANYATVGQEAAQSAEDAAQSATDAAGSASDAETAKTAAQSAKTGAETAQTGAQAAKTAAETAQGKAETAQTGAQAAQTAAEASKTQAAGSASAAATSATNAGNSATAAAGSATAAATAKTGAETAQAAAETAKTGAETAAASVSASAAQIETNKQDITTLKNDLSTIWGTQTATITGTAEGSARAYLPLIKGRKYAYTNNTTSSVTVRLYKADGTGVTLSNNLVKNTTFYFTCDATDYVAIGGYFAQAGSCSLTSIDDGVYSIIDGSYTSYIVNNNNYSTVLSNANSTKPHSIYTIWGASDFTISNMPDNWSSYSLPTVLIDFSGNSTGIRYQWILRGLGANAVIYTRSGYGADFNDWRLVNEKIKARPILTVGAGKDVATILDAGLYAKAHPNTNLHILVYGGTYDLISEFEAKYGSTYFSSMTEGEYGVPAGYGETWEFAPDAQIVANYTGNNVNVLTSFCPFFFAQGGGNYDCTMIGANINATNVKYCIHDEMSGSSIPYVHRYENCEFVINQHNISDFGSYYSWTASRCIGGGLGKSGNIIINGCHFISNNESGNATCLSYHNSSATEAKSTLTITNNYFNAGHTYANSANASTTSTLETKVILSGNSFGAAPDTTTKNMMVVYAWNNEVRTA